jgi:hypothetical protein
VEKQKNKKAEKSGTAEKERKKREKAEKVATLIGTWKSKSKYFIQ